MVSRRNCELHPALHWTDDCYFEPFLVMSFLDLSQAILNSYEYVVQFHVRNSAVHSTLDPLLALHTSGVKARRQRGSGMLD